VWCAVLRLERVGIHDNFLDLGGDSVSAMTAICRIRDVVATELPVRAFFEKLTIAALAQEIDRAHHIGTAGSSSIAAHDPTNGSVR
jgi:hypothetical protein